jgi:acetylornithine aminotransferase
MSSETILTEYAGSYARVFGTPRLALTRGQGCTVWDESGKEYLDLLGGIAVNSVGHAHPRWVSAVAEQAGRLAHVSNFFATGPQVELAQKLLTIADMPTGSAVFLANSGTEALEAAFKLARRHGIDHGNREEIIAFDHAFHGRTMGALALTAKKAYREPFEPMPGGVRHIPYGDPEVARVEITEKTAAVIIEPIQGEAGVILPPDGFLRELREITSQVGALLIVDEVQTGIGRTGQWLASAGVEPDAVTLAKGLGGGFPIGALLTRGPEVSMLLGPGQHGSTFGGNPLASATALATLEIIETEGLMANAAARGIQLLDGLRKVAGVAAARGSGLLVGIDLEPGLSAPAVVTAAQEAGFIINATGDSTLRLAPPLLITEEEIARFLGALPALLARH